MTEELKDRMGVATDGIVDDPEIFEDIRYRCAYWHSWSSRMGRFIDTGEGTHSVTPISVAGVSTRGFVEHDRQVCLFIDIVFPHPGHENVPK
jgi:hypothetical protein